MTEKKKAGYHHLFRHRKYRDQHFGPGTFINAADLEPKVQELERRAMERSAKRYLITRDKNGNEVLKRVPFAPRKKKTFYLKRNNNET